MAITRVTMRLQNEIDRLMRQITDRTQRELQAAWASAWDEVRADLVDAVAAALTSGTRVTITQMRTNRRLALVLQMVLARLQDLVTDTERAVFADLQGLVDAAVAAQGSIVDSQFPPGTDLTQIGRWSRVDIRQVDAMVVRTTRRIHSLNRPLPAQAVAGMKRELIRGISVGSNPRVTARRIVARAGDAGFGGGLVRAMTIARTETLDAYREATRVAQEPHADVLDGWQWLASLSPRTCPACLSMHGRSFPLTEPGPNGHQNCRCTRIPKLASWADLGLEGIVEPPSLMPDADAYFEGLTPTQKQAMLGKRGYQAWLAGDWGRDQWAVKRENAGWRDSWVNAKPPELQTGAGGGGVRVPPPKGPVPGAFEGPDAPKPGRVTRDKGVALEPHEILTGHRMASLGIDVHFLKPTGVGKTSDCWILGEVWEVKAPSGAGSRTIRNNLRDAYTHGPLAILDMTRSPHDVPHVVTELGRYWGDRRKNDRPSLDRVWVLPHNVNDQFIEERP